MPKNPLGIPADIVALTACAGTRGGKDAPFVETHGKPQLIHELLRETTGTKPLGNASNQPRALGRAKSAMLKASAHHCSRPPVPKAF
jgi:hypothetical protein